VALRRSTVGIRDGQNAMAEEKRFGFGMNMAKKYNTILQRRD